MGAGVTSGVVLDPLLEESIREAFTAAQRCQWSDLLDYSGTRNVPRVPPCQCPAAWIVRWRDMCAHGTRISDYKVSTLLCPEHKTEFTELAGFACLCGCRLDRLPEGIGHVVLEIRRIA